MTSPETVKTIKVAYLGPPGTFSHQAAIQKFSKFSKNFKVEYIPQRTIGDCFNVIANNTDQINYSVLPFENSTNGSVVLSYDLFRDYFIKKRPNNDILKQKVRVVGEEFVTICHNLITNQKDLSKIKKIYTHPQVWTQCNKFLNGLNFEKIDTSSTSKAAELIKNTDQDDCAAIGSLISSQVHNVPILYNNIEDDSNNTTRFLILTNDNEVSNDDGISNEKFLNDYQLGNKFISLIVFNIENSKVGSLSKILTIFNKFKLNIATINSRPSNLAKWQYVFFFEIFSNSNVNSANNNANNIENNLEILKELKENCIDFEILGSFKRNEKYYQSAVNFKC
ncbi:prephenate dehydratase PHA2 [Ascoidea rubescens DSM 1968]|uniref:prephenate dehydratase n=1 Tax=Ascoidea rubescens DSM 1968 TaxID=1344418 RepID=A0A1D2VH45_9ASCO|nr:PDT-domain-containing protein [Ascoidea rubescens DSM 1968]ODV60813.1 PDT-domain-containing protein [Ascoidea rubescens DSM 1968]